MPVDMSCRLRCLSVDVDRNPAPLAALVPSYRPIFDRLLASCEGDDRVRALWLSGSVAKGTADGGSDLDILLAIRDDDFDGFVVVGETGSPQLPRRSWPGSCHSRAARSTAPRLAANASMSYANRSATCP
ncbi:MAG: nucleotidyltransferase domain-containing protein [Nocardioidaceae bacterium]